VGGVTPIIRPQGDDPTRRDTGELFHSLVATVAPGLGATGLRMDVRRDGDDPSQVRRSEGR
jgi:hypothetical protein